MTDTFCCQVVLHLLGAFGVFWLIWALAVDLPEWLRWTPGLLIEFSWLLFAAYWLMAAFGAKKSSKTELVGARLAYIAFMVVGFFLLYDFAPPVLDFLNHRLFPTDQWIRWMGRGLYAGRYNASPFGLAPRLGKIGAPRCKSSKTIS